MRLQTIVSLLVISPIAVLDAADRHEPPPPTGAWSREIEGLELRIDLPANSKTMKLTVLAGDNNLQVHCDYEWQKGIIHAKIREVVVKGDFPVKPEVGSKFRFQFRVTGKTAVVSDYHGDVTDEARRFFEGEYTRVPATTVKPE